MFDIAVFKMGPGQRFRIVTSVILPGRVEGRMRVKGIDTEQPGLVGLTVAPDELDRFFRAPMRLMQVRRHVVIFGRRFAESAETGILVRVSIIVQRRNAALLQDAIVIDALSLDPFDVFVAPLVAALVVVAVLEIIVAIVDALF